MDNNCPFCTIDETKIVLRNETCFAVYDIFPATEGHMLVVPLRHAPSFFDYTPEEISDVWALVSECKGLLDERFSPDGYNIGMNLGECAGQTVFHLHIHIIPRRIGDTENPKGGIRHAVRGKGSYGPRR
ncbi:histidine triad (HIT) protein [Denitrovibrio acetiphilus DSM 12809]|uniref:Histidine triad (HIT) protein n=1 Tax=Denitrovibrio acetiphilus (strain DSM 12809 / NBRC 114555 / N2460) TaxID=522772 RepID=D4H6X1_DENA2|nr:HIT family protein [Denitrovibrio acetiphilus]ADD67837.1 histidine triad (HIT) protein [Denitrovibrio acetiphilus DSM 12809]